MWIDDKSPESPPNVRIVSWLREKADFCTHPHCSRTCTPERPSSLWNNGPLSPSAVSGIPDSGPSLRPTANQLLGLVGHVRGFSPLTLSPMTTIVSPMTTIVYGLILSPLTHTLWGFFEWTSGPFWGSFSWPPTSLLPIHVPLSHYI